jgi:integrase-like protein
MDITYIPMMRGFVYLAVVLDWFSRRVLAWCVSITMEAAFCVETLEDALAHHDKPDIFNTDQGSATKPATAPIISRSTAAMSVSVRSTRPAAILPAINGFGANGVQNGPGPFNTFVRMLEDAKAEFAASWGAWLKAAGLNEDTPTAQLKVSDSARSPQPLKLSPRLGAARPRRA